jgi:hypothetical protein
LYRSVAVRTFEAAVGGGMYHSHLLYGAILNWIGDRGCRVMKLSAGCRALRIVVPAVPWRCNDDGLRFMAALQVALHVVSHRGSLIPVAS